MCRTKSKSEGLLLYLYQSMHSNTDSNRSNSLRQFSEQNIVDIRLISKTPQKYLKNLGFFFLTNSTYSKF